MFNLRTFITKCTADVAPLCMILMEGVHCSVFVCKAVISRVLCGIITDLTDDLGQITAEKQLSRLFKGRHYKWKSYMPIA